MLSQFAPVRKKRTLADIDFSFPEGVNALGRLDDNSEGLLLLTNDTSVNQKLMHPSQKHERVYWVQVHGEVNNDTLKKLESGVIITLEGKDYQTIPCKVKTINPPEALPPRAHPVGTHFATSWLELTLYEGKFHQIRKMTAAVGHQTMRLIRISVEGISLPEFMPGHVKEYEQKEFYNLLKIDAS